jgi:hypothetical protein
VHGVRPRTPLDYRIILADAFTLLHPKLLRFGRWGARRAYAIAGAHLKNLSENFPMIK